METADNSCCQKPTSGFPRTKERSRWPGLFHSPASVTAIDTQRARLNFSDEMQWKATLWESERGSQPRIFPSTSAGRIVLEAGLLIVLDNVGGRYYYSRWFVSSPRRTYTFYPSLRRTRDRAACLGGHQLPDDACLNAGRKVPIEQRSRTFSPRASRSIRNWLGSFYVAFNAYRVFNFLLLERTLVRLCCHVESKKGLYTRWNMRRWDSDRVPEKKGQMRDISTNRRKLCRVVEQHEDASLKF